MNYILCVHMYIRAFGIIWLGRNSCIRKCYDLLLGMTIEGIFGIALLPSHNLVVSYYLLRPIPNRHKNRLEHINALSRNVEYLASRDATIMGSRNGHAPLFLWYTLNCKGYRGFQKEVQKCLRNAHYLQGRLTEAGIGAMLNELSSTFVFERLQDEEFTRKWQLACQGNIAHVVVQ